MSEQRHCDYYFMHNTTNCHDDDDTEIIFPRNDETWRIENYVAFFQQLVHSSAYLLFSRISREHLMFSFRSKWRRSSIPNEN